MSHFYAKINLEERDFFTRFRQAQQVRWELLIQYPELFEFLNAAYTETASDIRPYIELRNKGLTQDALGKILAGFDRTKFKEGLDIDKVINIIVWTFHGFLKDRMKRAKALSMNSNDYVQMVKEADEYIDMFRQSFYK